MNTKVLEKTESKSKELVIDLGLNDKAIDELSKKYMPLKLQGPDDKEGYAKIVEYRKDVKDHRLAVQTAHKKEKAFYLEGGRKVDAEKNRLLNRLQPIENHLIGQENIVKNELARIKAEKEQKAEKIYQDRLYKVLDSGAFFNGTAYMFGDNSAGPEGIRVMTDDEFSLLTERIQIWREKEDFRIAEELKAKKAEEDRQAKIAEDNKIKQEKLDKQKEEQEKAQAKINEDKRLVAQQKIDARMKEIIMAGAVFDGIGHTWPNGSLNADALVHLHDDDWDEQIVDVKKKVKAKADQDAKDAESKQIADKKKQDAEVEAAKKKATEDAEKEVKRKAQEKADQEKKEKMAAEKKAKLAPDKEKLLEFADNLEDLQYSAPKSPEANEVLDQALRLLSGLIGELRDGANKL